MAFLKMPLQADADKFSPLPSMRYKKKISGPGRVLTKRSGAPEHRMPRMPECLRMPTEVIADIALLGGNVIIIPVSWALNVNA